MHRSIAQDLHGGVCVCVVCVCARASVLVLVCACACVHMQACMYTFNIDMHIQVGGSICEALLLLPLVVVVLY